MNMFSKNPKRPISLAAFYMVLLCGSIMTLMTGCSDSTSGPSNSSATPLGLNATVLVSDPVTTQEANEVRANVSKNENDSIAIEPEQVETIVIQLYPGGEVVGVHLDYDRDSLNYECAVRSGGKVYIVVIDPKTGKVKEQKEVKDYYYTTNVKIKNKVKVKVKEACQKAKDDVEDSKVVEANLEEVEGQPTYIIILITNDNRYITIYIDAETGKERKLKDEDRCAKNEDNDDQGADHDGDIKSGDCDGHKNKKGRGHYRHGKGKGYGHYFHCHCECECENGGGTGGGSDSLKVEIISADSAQGIIEGYFQVDSSAIASINLDVENDSTAYYNSVVEIDSNRYEVRVNAVDGALVEVTQTAGDFENGEYTPPTITGVTLVTLSVARTAAMAQATGEVQGWTLKHDMTLNKWVYVFTIVDTTNSTTKTVRVDATTGTFIDVV